MTTNREPHEELPDNVRSISRGPYADEPVGEEDVLLEEWMSTLDPEKHRILPKDETFED